MYYFNLFYLQKHTLLFEFNCAIFVCNVMCFSFSRYHLFSICFENILGTKKYFYKHKTYFIRLIQKLLYKINSDEQNLSWSCSLNNQDLD